ncbi:radical SAM protein [Asanoa ishikariensis]|uniref:Intein C-terminal splicing region/intein N-terminal splicing region n=1 Tax=Asanoa ishikariensis TaxID=137265 RepID=A0A1H3QMX8_9ACTN|nr:intein-containing Rv2578c family radical SAM protein [Asanoa ishikariensis]GIF64864.1 radical SAM protein [Asanoa ishikariensis]SDZ14756.1 intein C-terminal splicing region/intein N-terminal splicing region [Asanoa ishikariensis]
MRWDNLSALPASVVPDRAAPATPPLPLALPGAVARTFDTPGFAGMTFYEVRAKSIINRVPGNSRMGFDWTINPYRGCSHACTYCLDGDTRILMADGRTRALRDLKVGDRIYGTVRSGSYRRYVITDVLAHWRTTKPGYRVTLADGTELVASGDHRFLTERGWKHVTGSMGGADQRPHLTSGNKLMGVGQFAAPPADTTDYRAGYLCGMSRGDLSVTDREPLDRTRRYLAEAPPSVARLAAEGRMVFPASISDDWRKGFLAGVFDAQGSHDGTALRIGSIDRETIDQVAAALRALDFDFAVRRTGGAKGWYVRIVGGLAARLRFLHTTDPAATGKRSIEGLALKSNVPLDVVKVEPLGVDLPLYDITTGTGDFIANGVVSHNCFARNTHTYLDLDPGHDFDSKIIVKVNAGDLVRKELSARRWQGEHIAMGTNVDVYQRAEGRYRLMPQILSALRDFANPFSILTKGTLILRDLELLRQAASVTSVGLSFSIGFVDEELWRRVEPGTPSPQRRLDAVRRLTDAGFRVGVLVAPILPGLTDNEESIDRTVASVAAAGAAGVTGISLHLRPGTREWYAKWLGREFPDLVPRYRELYRAGSYVPKDYQREITARVRQAARRHGLDRQESFESRQLPDSTPPEPEQLTLL